MRPADLTPVARDVMKLPTGPGLIIGSLLAAYLFNALPWSGWLLLLRPDLVMIVMLFWVIHQPSSVGQGLAFALGLAMDAALASDAGRSNAAFKKVYEEEFRTFGGAPFGTLIGQFELSRQPEDMYFIEQMSHIAAASHAPFIAAASPQLFGLDSYTELGKPRDMGKVFDTVEYAKWKSFRESEDSRYVGLALPRFLGRLPYNPIDGEVTEGFNFVEEVDGTNHDKYLWCNAAFAFAARLTTAFENYGWCAAIRGVEGGGLVEDLPTHTFRTDHGEVALKCPTEISITDRREKELSDLGFIPLVHCKNTDSAAFFGAQSAQKPNKYDIPAKPPRSEESCRGCAANSEYVLL